MNPHGRPKLGAKARTKMVNFRLTEAEVAAIKAWAGDRSLTLICRALLLDAVKRDEKKQAQ